jgi:DNA-binding MarR family transcriptional regulator
LLGTINFMPASSHAASETAGAVDAALGDLVRLFNKPAFVRRLTADANVAIEVGASWALARIGRIGPCRLSDVAASLGVDASTITHRVQALERAGYVERVADPADGRASIVRLSAEGVAALERIRAVRREIFEGLVADWTDEERTAFTAMVERLTAALTEELSEA